MTEYCGSRCDVSLLRIPIPSHGPGTPGFPWFSLLEHLPGQGLLRTPLHYAILQANSEIAEVLMKAGADASEADIDGMSPLSFAETALGLLKSVEME